MIGKQCTAGRKGVENATDPVAQRPGDASSLTEETRTVDVGDGAGGVLLSSGAIFSRTRGPVSQAGLRGFGSHPSIARVDYSATTEKLTLPLTSGCSFTMTW